MRQERSIVRWARLAAALVIAMCAALPLPSHAEGPDSVSALAAKLSPAVVNIGTSRRVPFGLGVPFPEAPEGSPLNELFENLNPNQGQGEERMQEARSLGSGFIVSAEGIVVTNNHVVEGASEILVFLNDGTRLPATLVGADTKTDLAVLKVDAGHDLPFVEFGNSDTAEIGDWVMAIGNPFGLGGSVTLGIVSARSRDIQSGPYDDFIQTDASINQGNSGGPLFDMDGNVVGINTAIIAQGGTSLGIGFAVPGNIAKVVIGQLAEFGETRRGWLGVGIQEVTGDMAASLGRSNSFGALVNGVTPEGPAAGILKDGDLIIEFAGRAIQRMRDLPRIVAETEVGKAVPVKVLRGGEEIVVDVTLGRLELAERQVTASLIGETAPPEQAEEAVGPPPTLKDLVGFGLEPLTVEMRETYGIDATQVGLVVTEVEVGSDAEEKGVIAGLMVVEVNQKAVGTVAEVASLVGQAKETGRPAVLLKVNDPAGSSRFIAVRIE